MLIMLLQFFLFKTLPLWGMNVEFLLHCNQQFNQT